MRYADFLAAKTAAAPVANVERIVRKKADTGIDFLAASNA